MSAEDDLAAFEAAVLRQAGIGQYLARVDVIRRLLAEGSETLRGLVLGMRPPRVEAQALAAVLDAYGIGARDALTVVEGMGLDDLARIGRPSAATRAIVSGLNREVTAAFGAAQKLAAAGAPLDTLSAPLLGLGNTISGRVTRAVNASGNEGSTAVADAAGLATVWVAETNACVRCLRYSGTVAKPGKAFPAGLTYGNPKHATSEALPHPPLHPHCRCTVEPLRAQEYADALRREADRSVLRGFSLESESMAVRVDAAERLILTGADAPKSVVAYAKKSIKSGAFATRGRP